MRKKKGKPFNTRLRCLREELSIRFNLSFRGISRKCSRRKPLNKMLASATKKVFSVRNNSKETRSSMNTS